MFEYNVAKKSFVSTTVLEGGQKEEFGFSVSLSGQSLVVGAPASSKGSGET